LAAQVTVGIWTRRFLEAHAVGLKPSTAASYESLYRCCIGPYLAEHRLDRLRKSHVREWVAELSARGLSASRVRQALVVLTKAIEAAVDDDLISANPCRGVSPPALPATELHTLSAEQVQSLREAIRPPFGLLVDLLAVGGLRIGEALALRRRSVDLLRGRLLVSEALSEVGGKHRFGTTKAHQGREVPLPRFLAERLTEHLAGLPSDPRALLFTSAVGGPVRYRSLIRYAWAPAIEATGLRDVTPHDLRATCASWIAEQHGVMAAARHLGHSSASVTTRHYARARQGSTRRSSPPSRPPSRVPPGNETESDRARRGHETAARRREQAADLPKRR